MQMILAKALTDYDRRADKCDSSYVEKVEEIYTYDYDGGHGMALWGIGRAVDVFVSDGKNRVGVGGFYWSGRGAITSPWNG